MLSGYISSFLAYLPCLYGNVWQKCHSGATMVSDCTIAPPGPVARYQHYYHVFSSKCPTCSHISMTILCSAANVKFAARYQNDHPVFSSKCQTCSQISTSPPCCSAANVIRGTENWWEPYEVTYMINSLPQFVVITSAFDGMSEIILSCENKLEINFDM